MAVNRTRQIDQAAATETSVPAVSTSRAPRRRAYFRKTDQVLEAAERAFLESGYAGTSMDHVATLANVSKRTVYSNFQGKEDLFAAVIRKRCSEVLPGVLEEIDLNTDDPEPLLIDLAVRFLTSIFSKPQVQLYQTVVAASRRFPEIGKMMFQGPIADSQQVFDTFIRAQVARGNLAFPDIDLAAPHLVALLKSNIHMGLLFEQPIAANRRLIARHAEAAIRLFLRGAYTDRARKRSAATARSSAPPGRPRKPKA